jgi:hypothetical protein
MKTDSVIYFGSEGLIARKSPEHYRCSGDTAEGVSRQDGSSLPMVARFQRCRWGMVRKKLESLQEGQDAIFSREQADVAWKLAQRMNDAYEGTRHLKAQMVAGRMIVRRIMTP